MVINTYPARSLRRGCILRHTLHINRLHDAPAPSGDRRMRREGMANHKAEFKTYLYTSIDCTILDELLRPLRFLLTDSSRSLAPKSSWGTLVEDEILVLDHGHPFLYQIDPFRTILWLHAYKWQLPVLTWWDNLRIHFASRYGILEVGVAFSGIESLLLCQRINWKTQPYQTIDSDFLQSTSSAVALNVSRTNFACLFTAGRQCQRSRFDSGLLRWMSSIWLMSLIGPILILRIPSLCENKRSVLNGLEFSVPCTLVSLVSFTEDRPFPFAMLVFSMSIRSTNHALPQVRTRHGLRRVPIKTT